MNYYIFSIINGLAGRSALLDQIMIFSAKYLVSIIPIIVVALLLARKTENKKAAIFITISVGLSLLLGYITKGFTIIQGHFQWDSDWTWSHMILLRLFQVVTQQVCLR